MWYFWHRSIAVAPLEQCVLKGDFNFDADFGAYTNPGEETWVTLHAGDFLVTPPSDAHKPGCTLEKSGSKLKKAVMKVRINREARLPCFGSTILGILEHQYAQIVSVY